MMGTLLEKGAFTTSSDLYRWLEQVAKKYTLRYLLAHADDGVIWGRFDGQKLTTTGEAFAKTEIEEVKVLLRPETLQQARLFGQTGEVLLWRTDKGYFARYLNEDGVPTEDRIQESYWLWGEGMSVDGVKDFTLMHDGREGLRHAPPLPLGKAKGRRGQLLVYHHLTFDDKGQAFIARSRLVDLEIVPEVNHGVAA